MTTTVKSLAPAHPIIEVVHEGTVTAADIRAAEKQILELANSGGLHLLLGNYINATDLPGAIDTVTLIESAIAALGGRAGGRHALLWPKDDQARIELDVARMAEKNQGVRIHIFGDRDAAIAWLES
jgi:hypothetical protein